MSFIFSWGSYTYKICFPPVHLSYVSLIARPVKESIREEGKTFPSLQFISLSTPQIDVVYLRDTTYCYKPARYFSKQNRVLLMRSAYCRLISLPYDEIFEINEFSFFSLRAKNSLEFRWIFILNYSLPNFCFSKD